MAGPQIFISYSRHDAFEAGLLQFAFEKALAEEGAIVWTFERDQSRSEQEIARSLKARVRESVATIFLLSPTTFESGATQWMELAYADAFGVETFILLHHLDHEALKKKERGVPPLLLSSQCTPATEWKVVLQDIKQLLKGRQAK